MPLTGVLKTVGSRKCPHCKNEYGSHSKKQFLRCLYTSDYNYYNLAQQYNTLIEEFQKFKEGVKGGEEKDKEEEISAKE